MKKTLLKFLMGLSLAIFLIAGGWTQHIQESLLVGGIMLGALLTNYHVLFTKHPRRSVFPQAKEQDKE